MQMLFETGSKLANETSNGDDMRGCGVGQFSAKIIAMT